MLASLLSPFQSIDTTRKSLRYGIALALFALALWVRFLLIGVLPARGFPFLSFFPAVLLAAWLTGLGPGLLVAALSTVAAWAFFMGPPVALHLMPKSDLIALVFFAGILVIDCIVIHLMTKAMRQLRAKGEELRASQSELMAREAELREADRQKDVFLATLAHELRNPLAPIRTAAQLISASSRDAGIGRAAAVIDRQSRQLTRLVDDLLDVSRIHTSKLHLRPSHIDLRQVLDSAIETCQPMIDTGQHAFSATIPAFALPVRVDAVRIAQCVSNLLHNAFKFTPPGGRIALAVELRGAEAVLVVSDNGRGISAAMLPRLFELFSQEHASGMHGNSGLGLGLALSHHLVAAHGGSLTAASDGAGQGARFELVLPLAEAIPAAAPSTDAIHCGPAGSRILIVDDNVDSAQMLQALLESEGHTVALAHDGASALATLGGWRPDVMFLDIGLPDISGYEVAIRARESGLLDERTRLVALTGWSDELARARSAAAGIEHHLNKPVAFDDVLSLLPGHHAHVDKAAFA
ncbi:Fused histidine kinase with GAF domain/response regulator receiver [Massilia sp. LC238]|nr:hybrid sensor histidine kinase/response regulator [Massilia sp. LC238]KFC65542.1 Fused histidine kinase with GAF domain/response regulator receiver [Massilia sp. LC238]